MIGGELSEAPQQLLAGVREVAIGRSLPMATRDLRVAAAGSGDRAGMIGAAIMVIEDVLAPANVDRAVAPARALNRRCARLSASSCPTSTRSPRPRATGTPTGAPTPCRR